MDGKWERDQRQKEGEEGCSLLSLAPHWTTAGQVHGSLPSPLSSSPVSLLSSKDSPPQRNGGPALNAFLCESLIGAEVGKVKVV